MSKPDLAVLEVVNILAPRLGAPPTSLYLGDLARQIVDTVRRTPSPGSESHPEWDACREQTEEELTGLTDAWWRTRRREYLALREAVLERNYS